MAVDERVAVFFAACLFVLWLGTITVLVSEPAHPVSGWHWSGRVLPDAVLNLTYNSTPANTTISWEGS